MADEAPKLIQIAPKGGEKKDGFNLVTERVVAVNPESKQLEVELLAYDGKTAIGWCAVAPRGEYVALGRSRVLKPIDAAPVWSVSCLFVAKEHRRRGVSVGLLKAAVEFVRKQGGEVVEGYPVEPHSETAPPPFIWTGTISAFERAGFKEAARGSPARPIFRCHC